MEWDQPISKEIFEKKYMINGEKNPDEVFRGISQKVASAEKPKNRKKYEMHFYDLIKSGKFIPAGRILANARPGTKMPYFNNCYTIGIDDHIEDIYDAVKEDALISRTGGGVGLNFSKLRPKNAPLSRGGESSGAVSFMKVFNESARIIQVGGARRSAHMGILDISHPDIEEFIQLKQGSLNNELTQFNISVGMTDAFMDAVDADADWDLTFNGEVYKTVKANYLYDLLAKNSFIHNEPGSFNIDNVHREANSHYMYVIKQTNPCGEQSLPEYGVCDLGAINLIHFVRDPFSDKAWFDWDAFLAVVPYGVRFLDNVLDVTEYPLKKIKKLSMDERRIGLGFTGYADMLAMLGMIYGSKESQAFTERLGQQFRDEAYVASHLLAREKGKFKKFSRELLDSGFAKRLPDYIRKGIRKHGLRNIAILTVAPTGTTSLSLGQNCSSGIEPMFSLKYDRTIRTGAGEETKTETVYDYAYLRYLDYLEKNDIGLRSDQLPEVFVTTADVDIYDAIDIQAIWQKYIDSSISKTINLPPGTTFEQYKDIYKYAYRKGLKGVTTFNPEGSIAGILSATPKKEVVVDDDIPESHTQKRPKDLPCDIHQIRYKGDKYLCVIGMRYGRPWEVFVTPHGEQYDFNKHKEGITRKVKKGQYSLIIKNGSENIIVDNIKEAFDPVYGTLSRFISSDLRHHVPLQFIVKQLNKDEEFTGFARVVSRVLKKYIKEGEEVKTSAVCPECGGTKLMYKEGCMTCTCGWSKCS